MGLARQFKYEIDDCPPIVVLIARPAGRLAGQLVAGRRGHQHADRPGRGGARWSPSSCGGAPAASPSSASADQLPPVVAGPAHRADGRRRRSPADDTAWAMDEIMAGDATAGPAGRVRGAAAREGRDARGTGRPGADHARAGGPAARRRAAPSTSWAPAPTARTPSTSPRWPRWSWPAPAAAVVKHGNRAATSCCGVGRRAGGARRRHRPARGRGGAHGRRGGHRVLLRAGVPRRACGTPGRVAPRARACRPSSTSSAR